MFYIIDIVSRNQSKILFTFIKDNCIQFHKDRSYQIESKFKYILNVL